MDEIKAQRRLIRDQSIALAVFSGASVEKVANDEGIDVRTVYNAIRRTREAHALHREL